MNNSITNIRNAIASTLSVAHGQVHIFERYAKRSNDMKHFYEYKDRLKGWHIRRVSTREQKISQCRFERVYRWEIKGFWSLHDADETELLFDVEIERICDAFRENDTLDGNVDSCIVGQEANIQVLDSGPVMFAGVLCHSCRLGLNTRIYL